MQYPHELTQSNRRFSCGARHISPSAGRSGWGQPQTIGYLERGDYQPSLELALKIARHFGVAVEMLFSLDRFAMTFGRAGEGE